MLNYFQRIHTQLSFQLYKHQFLVIMAQGPGLPHLAHFVIMSPPICVGGCMCGRNLPLQPVSLGAAESAPSGPPGMNGKN